MSTTIEIIPVETSEITFGQVINTSEGYINDFIKSIGLSDTVKLSVNIHDQNEKYVNNIKFTDRFTWKDNEYAWFSIDGIAGGTDAYCITLNGKEIDPENPWWQLKDLELNNKTIENIKEKLEKSKSYDRLWYFRRSAGQPGIVAVSYGLISASVAKLTSGIIWSDDGAWDYQRFPAEFNHFLDWYFQPEKALSKDTEDWSRRCINGIKDELKRPTSK